MKKASTISIGVTISILVLAGTVFAMQSLWVEPTESGESWRAVRESIRPQLLRPNAEEKRFLDLRHLTETVYSGLVMHEGDTYTYVKKDHLTTWGISSDDARQTAIDNLQEYVADETPTVHTTANGGRYIIYETGDGYDAARLLLPSVQAKAEEELGTPFIAAIPTRDFLIFWEEDIAFADQFAEQVRQEYEADALYGLTPELFRISNRGIEVSPNES